MWARLRLTECFVQRFCSLIKEIHNTTIHIQLCRKTSFFGLVLEQGFSLFWDYMQGNNIAANQAQLQYLLRYLCSSLSMFSVDQHPSNERMNISFVCSQCRVWLVGLHNIIQIPVVRKWQELQNKPFWKANFSPSLKLVSVFSHHTISLPLLHFSWYAMCSKTSNIENSPKYELGLYHQIKSSFASFPKQLFSTQILVLRFGDSCSRWLELFIISTLTMHSVY